MFRNTRYIATARARKIANRKMTSFKIHGAKREESDDSDFSSEDELEQQTPLLTLPQPPTSFPSQGPSIDDRILGILGSKFSDSSDWIKVGTSSGEPKELIQPREFPGQPAQLKTDGKDVQKAFQTIRKSVEEGEKYGKLVLPVKARNRVAKLSDPKIKMIKRNCELTSADQVMNLLLTIDYYSSSSATVHWCYESTLILPQNTEMEQKVVEIDENTYRATLRFKNFTSNFDGNYYVLIDAAPAGKWTYFRVKMPEPNGSPPQFTIANKQKSAVLCGVKLSDSEKENFDLNWMKDGEKIDKIGKGVRILEKHEEFPKGSYAILEIQDPSLLSRGSYSVVATNSTGTTKEFQLDPFATTTFPPSVLSSPVTLVELFFNKTTETMKAQFTVYVKYRACHSDHDFEWKVYGNEDKMFETFYQRKVKIGADSYASGYTFESTQLLLSDNPPENLHFQLLIKTSYGQESCAFKLDLGPVCGSRPSAITLPDAMI